MSPITKAILKDICNSNIGINTNISADWSKCFFFHTLSDLGGTLLYLHDLEGAVGCVEELELLDGALRDGAESGPTPAPLHQANGLCCKQATVKKKKKKKSDKLVPLLAIENREEPEFRKVCVFY